MQIVFKVVTNPVPTNPVIADTNIQDHYTGMNGQVAWKEVKPTIEQVTDDQIMPFIGEAFYNDLAAKFNAGTALDAAQARALELLQRATIHYAAHALMSDKVAAITSAGIFQNAPEGANATNQWSFAEKKAHLLAAADTALDQLLEFLEKQTAVYFELWSDSSEAKNKKSVFFTKTADLDDYINMKKSRRTFVSVVPFLKSAENNIVAPLLCDDLWALVQTPNTDALRALVPYIKEIVAYKGCAEAVPHHRVVVDGDGFRVVSYSDGFQDRRNQTNSVHEQAVGALLTSYHRRGDEAITRLVKFLEKNLDTYPEYRDSECRTAPKDKSHGIMASPGGIGAVGLF